MSFLELYRTAAKEIPSASFLFQSRWTWESIILHVPIDQYVINLFLTHDMCPVGARDDSALWGYWGLHCGMSQFSRQGEVMAECPTLAQTFP